MNCHNTSKHPEQNGFLLRVLSYKKSELKILMEMLLHG